MAIGEYQDEQEWIDKKVVQYNNEKPGKGDTWALDWVNNREARYQPEFEKFINAALKKKCSIENNNKNAKYTIIAKTIFTEAGFYGGVTCRSANVHVEFIFVETANPGKILAKLIMNQEGYSDVGALACSGYASIWKRISGAYIRIGVATGKYLYYNVFK